MIISLTHYIRLLQPSNITEVLNVTMYMIVYTVKGKKLVMNNSNIKKIIYFAAPDFTVNIKIQNN